MSGEYGIDGTHAATVTAARRMTRWLAVLMPGSLAVLGTGCATEASRATDLGPEFGDAVGCMVLCRLDGTQLERINPERCAERFSPCSTFKVPNSLIGLETGAIADADFTLKWDGVTRDRAELNRDHTLRTAIQNSVVWYYQELARRVGDERMRGFIDRLRYGNGDLSGGLTTFWLGSSLKISADEQVAFLRNLHTGKLPLSRRSMDIVLDIMTQPGNAGVIYRGKTGSDRNVPGVPDLGWWIGTITRDGQTWVFAANTSGKGASGPATRRTVESFLRGRRLL